MPLLGEKNTLILITTNAHIFLCLQLAVFYVCLIQVDKYTKHLFIHLLERSNCNFICTCTSDDEIFCFVMGLKCLCSLDVPNVNHYLGILKLVTRLEDLKIQK